ncbi:hypothetical protein [Mangrovibrevibacter kandeliae]|uniref:hypothetical protein n=1 Tax=Mangrovibrevibacter kandeliae TaxID=2968473 RepID=UPI002117C236|nr:hypothetical protein [Aurantimonas sp. CSK15Z-1]MCQ8781704.1 hypothetical protein [Aurantimonas sp. CSK15Z-1]
MTDLRSVAEAALEALTAIAQIHEANFGRQDEKLADIKPLALGAFAALSKAMMEQPAEVDARDRTPAYFKAWLPNYLDEHVSSLKGMSAEDIADEHIDAAREIAEMAAQCLVAQPAPAPVAVKALEWNDHGDGDSYAISVVGSYHVAREREGGFPWDLPCGEEGYAASEEAARAACQADFEERIRSALSDARVPEGWRLVPEKPTEAMIEAGGSVLVAGLSTEEGADMEEVYRTMLAAAPAAPQEPQL